MNFLALAQERYTTKKYRRDKKVSGEQIEQLKEILRLSPSSIDSQPWKFLFITDEDKKRDLASHSYFNEEKVVDGSCLVVFTVADDIDLFDARIETYLPEGSVKYFREVVKPKGEQAIKNWMQHQVYLSLGFFSFCLCRYEHRQYPDGRN